MSGHSKWATIKHKKGALDAKRGKISPVCSGKLQSPQRAAATLTAMPGSAPQFWLPKRKTCRRKTSSAPSSVYRRTGRRELRRNHLRGIRPRRRRHHCGSHHRQPQRSVSEIVRSPTVRAGRSCSTRRAFIRHRKIRQLRKSSDGAGARQARPERRISLTERCGCRW